ncbi:Ribosomal protein S1 [Forsythia ovata]|uniref:Ribosomal protein S1 n=2 Tax=Forsythia ovata TaxID=205694 RepID=A0ABD1Q1J3_9LAMI
MSTYMSRLFSRSNSSIFLQSGTALQSKVLRLREEMFLVDAGIGTPRICTQDELIGDPKTKWPMRFENRVGYLDRVSGETPIKKQILERCFVDMVTGDSAMKERAAVRFNDLVGPTDSVSGEPLLLPRRFRKNRAWMELTKIWRTNSKVRGFIAEKVRGGYSVAIAGYIAFLPTRPVINRRPSDRFIIESMNPKTKNIVVVRT